MMNLITTRMGLSSVTMEPPVGRVRSSRNRVKTAMIRMIRYPAAVEYCDGVFNDCNALLYFIQEAPDPELDADEDGYVSCSSETEYGGVYAYDASDWVGATIMGDGDCDALDNTVYPYAPEVCDGQFNDCLDEDRAYQDAPDNELDDDGDKYVDCAYALSSWQGSGEILVSDVTIQTVSFIHPPQSIVMVSLTIAMTPLIWMVQRPRMRPMMMGMGS